MKFKRRNPRTNQTRGSLFIVSKQMNSFSCTKCQIEFPDSDSLRYHIEEELHGLVCIAEIMLSPTDSKYPSPFSPSFSSPYPYSLSSPTQSPPQECHLCAAPFKRKSDLTRHLKTVHSNHKKFPCPNCGKYFSRSDSLKVHMDMEKRKGWGKEPVSPTLSPFKRIRLSIQSDPNIFN